MKFCVKSGAYDVAVEAENCDSAITSFLSTADLGKCSGMINCHAFENPTPETDWWALTEHYLERAGYGEVSPHKWAKIAEGDQQIFAIPKRFWRSKTNVRTDFTLSPERRKRKDLIATKGFETKRTSHDRMREAVEAVTGKAAKTEELSEPLAPTPPILPPQPLEPVKSDQAVTRRDPSLIPVSERTTEDWAALVEKARDRPKTW